MQRIISYWSVAGGLENHRPIAEAMEEAKEAGFDGIELAIAEQGVLSVSSTREDCGRIRTLARGSGLMVDTLASGMSWTCSPTHPDPAIRERAYQLTAAALVRAGWLGMTSLLYVPGAVSIPWDPGYPPVPYDRAAQWAEEGIARLAVVAERENVELCVENVWNGLFYSPLEFAALIDRIASAKVGIYLDVGNLLGYHQHPEHWIAILGGRIRRVHIKDFRRSVGSLDGFCDLLSGDVPFARIMPALRAIGYARTLVAEMMPPRPDLLRTTRVAMDAILAM